MVLSQDLILLRMFDFRNAGHIFKRRKCLDFLTDFHIEERGKIKVDVISQALAKDRSVTVEIFCIFVTLYTKTGLTTQTEKFS